MTIDEMINKLNIERKQQEDTIKYLKYHKEDEHYIAPHREAISDCEQLVEWLEELKAIREELISNTRVKAIDEFVEKIKEKEEELYEADGGGIFNDSKERAYNNGIMAMDDVIDKIAEDLKAGVKNE